MRNLVLKKVLIGLAMASGFALFSASSQGAEIRTGWWRGRRVTFKVVDGRAIWQGDIVLGRAEDIAKSPPLPAGPKDLGKNATFIGYPRYLWPNATVPYVIAPTVPARLRNLINSAIQTYTDNTPIRWIPRTNEA